MDCPCVPNHLHHDSIGSRSASVPNTYIVGAVNVRRWPLHDARLF